MRRFGVDKGHQTMNPLARLLVDQAHPLGAQFLQRHRNVIHRKADMMHPFPAVLQKTRRATALIQRCQEFQRTVAGVEKRDRKSVV